MTNSDLLYVIGTSRVQHRPPESITLQVGVTDIYIQYRYAYRTHNVSLRDFYRALTWYHNGNKLTPGGRITLSSDNTTLTVINSTVADSGVYEARFDGLLIHPYSRICEKAVLDILRHYPVLKPAVFHVGTTITGETITLWHLDKTSGDGESMVLQRQLGEAVYSLALFLLIQYLVMLSDCRSASKTTKQ